LFRSESGTGCDGSARNTTASGSATTGEYSVIFSSSHARKFAPVPISPSASTSPVGFSRP
jgi:hypothetical protein